MLFSLRKVLLFLILSVGFVYHGWAWVEERLMDRESCRGKAGEIVRARDGAHVKCSSSKIRNPASIPTGTGGTGSGSGGGRAGGTAVSIGASGPSGGTSTGGTSTTRNPASAPSTGSAGTPTITSSPVPASAAPASTSTAAVPVLASDLTALCKGKAGQDILISLNKEDLVTGQITRIQEKYTCPTLGDDKKQACKDARRELNDAVSDTSEKCREANMGASVSECFKEQQDCKKSDQSSDGADNMEKFRDALAGDTSSSNPTPSQKMCLSEASAGYDDRKKEVERLEEEVNNLKDELLQEQGALEELKLEAKAKAKDLARKAEDEMNKLKQKSKETQSAQSQILSELDAGLREAYNKKTELQLTLSDIDTELNQAQRAVAQECEMKALEAFAKLQANIQQGIVQGTYTTSSLNSLYSRAGVSSKEQYKRKYSEFRKQCKSGSDYKNKQTNLKQNSERKKERVHAAMTNLNKTIKAVKDQIEQRKAQLPEELKEIAEEMKTLVERSESDLAALHEQYNAKIRNKQAAVDQLAKRLAQKEADLAKKKQELQMREEILQTRGSAGVSSEVGSRSKAVATFAEIRSRTGEVESHCCADELKGDSSMRGNCEYARAKRCELSGDDYCDSSSDGGSGSGSGRGSGAYR